jgi:hypothetical protein
LFNGKPQAIVLTGNADACGLPLNDPIRSFEVRKTQGNKIVGSRFSQAVRTFGGALFDFVLP